MLFTALITILNQFKQEQKLNKGITLASEKSLSVTTVLSEDVDGWVESTASTTTTSLERRWFRVTRQRRGRRERGLWRPPVEEPKRPRQRASPWCREGHSGACPVLRDAHRGNGAAALIDMLSCCCSASDSLQRALDIYRLSSSTFSVAEVVHPCTCTARVLRFFFFLIIFRKHKLNQPSSSLHALHAVLFIL